MTPVRAFRWRQLTPAQSAAIAKAYDAGVSARDLAQEYSVDRRTIYRSVARAKSDVITEVRVGQYRADYAITGEGPIQLTPWLPAE